MQETLETIIGIDPGLTHPGAAELCRFPHGWTAISIPQLHSMEELAGWLTERMRNPPPGLRLVAIESVQPAVWGMISKAKTDYEALKIIQCKGLALLFASFHSVPCVEVAPVTMRKTIVGNGNASKEQMRMVIRQTVRQWPTRCNLNQTDAAAVALAAMRRTLPHALVGKVRSRHL